MFEMEFSAPNNSVLIYEPSLAQIVHYFSLLFEKIKNCIDDVTNIEPDLLKFLKIESVPLFQVNPCTKDGESPTYVWFDEAYTQVNIILTKCLEEPMNLLNEYKEFNWVIESDIDQEIDKLRRYKEIQKEMNQKTKGKDNEEEEFDEDGNVIAKRRDSIGSLDSQGNPKKLERKMSIVSKQSAEEREEEMKESLAKAKATKRRKSQGDIALEQRKNKKREYAHQKLDMPPSEYIDD
jgi:hypothetical protein